MEYRIYSHGFRKLEPKGMSHLFQDFVRSFHLVSQLAARTVVLPVLGGNPHLVSYSEVYRSAVLISLGSITLLYLHYILLYLLP